MDQSEYRTESRYTGVEQSGPRQESTRYIRR